MYKILKFSWSHIFAYIALIGIGYVSYTGLFYDLDQGYINPCIYTSLILLVLIIWFIGAQKLKGVSNQFFMNFNRCILIERLFVFSSPVILAVCMIPFNYAMNVAEKADCIEEMFIESVTASRNMFEKYEDYFKLRIDEYEDLLNDVKDNREKNATLYDEIGFDGVNDEMKINVEIETLTRQLNGIENYQRLEKLACTWLDRVNQKTNVWNVFFIGDLTTIEKTINEWSSNLENFSNKILTTENAKSFDNDKEYLNDISEGLNSLKDIFNPEYGFSGVNHMAIVYGIIAYLFLLFPWILQGRHGTNPYLLIGKRNTLTIKKHIPKTTAPIKMSATEEERKSRKLTMEEELALIKEELESNKTNEYIINNDIKDYELKSHI